MNPIAEAAEAQRRAMSRLKEPKCGRKKLSTGPCIKPKGHVSAGDKRHTDGKYSWGKWW